MTNKDLRGTLMVLAAGIAWGLSGVSGQYLMAHGFHVNLLVSLRLIVSGAFLMGLAFLTQRASLIKALKQWQVWWGVGLFSLFGLTLNQYAYLLAIAYTNAGTATVLQYMAPIIILIYLCLKGRIWPSWAELLAIGLAVSGTFIMATHGHLDSLSMTPLGLFWGLGSAVTYTLYILLPLRLIRTWGSLIVIGLGMLMGGLVFPILTQSWRHPLPLTGGNLLALFGLVGVGTIFAYSVFLKGTAQVGAVKGSLLASIEPVASVIFALTLMSEVFYPIDLLGMALILLAVLLISLRDLLRLRRQAEGRSAED